MTARSLWYLFLALAGCLVASAGRARAEDMTLTELSRRAVARSGRIGAARMISREARARASEVRAGRWATVKVEAFLGPSPSIDCADPSCVTTRPTEQRVAFDGVLAGVSLHVRQPIYSFGKYAAGRSAADHAIIAAGALERHTQAQAELDVRRAYYGLLLSRELIDLFEEAQQRVAEATDKVAEGLAAQSGAYELADQLRLEALAAEVSTRLSEARQGESEALAALRALSGPDVRVKARTIAPITFDLGGVAAPSVARQRPDVQAARSLWKATDSLAKVQEDALWPDLAVVGLVNLSVAQGADDPPSAFAYDPLNRRSVVLGLAARWVLDVSAWARIEQARARERKSRAQLTDLEISASLDAERTLARARSLRERMQSTSRGVDAARRWRAAQVQAEALGVIETRSLVDAYLTLYTTQASHLRAIHDWNLTVAELEWLGGSGRGGSDVDW